MPGKKLLRNIGGVITEVFGVQTSTGAANAGDIPALNNNGVFDTSLMPPGIGADTATVTASEALSANDLVNIWNNAGTAAVRKADATTSGKEAHGFVTASVTSGNPAPVFFEGTNAGQTGLTPGVQFLSTTAGKSTTAPPSTTGNVSQVVGFATSATSMNFQSEPPIVLA